MNIQESINKLIKAIKIKGKDIKLETKTFYSDKSDKMLTLYILYDKRETMARSKKAKIQKWFELYSGYSKVKLLQTLVDYYYKIGSEANGTETNRETEEIY